MDRPEHPKERHDLLYQYLDRLLVDYISDASISPEEVSFRHFMKWSYVKIVAPTEEK